MKLRAVIYARCSTEEEAQKDALVKQVWEAEACVQKQGWILEDSYVESRSGTSRKGRAEYNRLYQDMCRDRFDVIVIKSQDRLMRNTKDWYLFVDRLVSEKKKLYLYLEQKFYSADDALITGIKAILAEEYSRELSRKMNHAHRIRQKSGGTPVLTSRTYGYRKMADKSVKIDEAEAKNVRRMYELCAAGNGGRRIASILRGEGIKKPGGKPFTDRDVLRIIRSPLNKGTVIMNRTHYDFDSKIRSQVPKEEQFVYEDKIPAIVSGKLWACANDAVDKRKASWGQKNVTGRNSGRALLSGKIYCGLCGAPYYRTVRKKGCEGEKICEWKCRNYLEYGRKGCSNIPVNEAVFFEFLNQSGRESCNVEDKEVIQKIIRLLAEVLQREEKKKAEQAKGQFLQLEKQMDILMDKLLDGVVTDEAYRKKRYQLAKRLERLEKEIEDGEKRGAGKEEEWMAEQEKAQIKRLQRTEDFLKEGTALKRAKTAAILKRAGDIWIYPSYMLVGERKARMEYGSLFDYRKRKQEEREKIAGMLEEKPQMTVREIAERLGIGEGAVRYQMQKGRMDKGK